MNQFKFVKTMATDLHITVSQRGEPIVVIVPGVEWGAYLVEWSIEVKVETGLPLLYKRLMMPSTVTESDVMVMVDAVIGIEFTQGMAAVNRFEIQEGDF